jgi:putative hydrolase of the HAD superfamily
MSAALRAVIFDLGGTLVDWPQWLEDTGPRWALSYDHLMQMLPSRDWPAREIYVKAMIEAEEVHWQRVDEEHWSGPPSGLLSEGFRRLGLHMSEHELLAALDSYAKAVDGWAVVFPDARETLLTVRQQGYRLGLLSNTWWAAEWHNADLATHQLNGLIDELVYTSDLPHSKPHPFVFQEVARRLNVEPQECVMIGDRLIDDISGALGVGMRAIWRKNTSPWPQPTDIQPTAIINALAELPLQLQTWRSSTSL